MHAHFKKMIAPVIITVIAVLTLGGWVLGWFLIDEIPVFAKCLTALIPLALIGVSIFVLVERIQEIRSGEEDDLSNY